VNLPQGDTVAAYEQLRTAVLSAQIGGYFGLGILRRAGLATWMREAVAGPCQIASSGQSPPATARPTATPDALTGLMAGIVLALAKETALA
jgi:hypothetical protein